MGKIKIKVDAMKCDRCGYVNVTRIQDPKNCPQCKQPYDKKPVRNVNAKKKK